jgi:hypothetical protein
MNESPKDSKPAGSDKPHWILRITPERHRQRVTRIAIIFGAICTMVWMLAAFIGLFLGPLAFTVWRPTAPISQPILWLRRVSGPDAFILTYSLSMLLIIAIVFTGQDFLQRVKPNARNA